MKRTMSRSIISLILAAAFVLGLGVLCFRYIRDGAMWANQPYNWHRVDNQQIIRVYSRIFDRNGALLSGNEDGERRYHEDYNVRLGTMHCVSDRTDTSVDLNKKPVDYGYNGLLGYSLPKEEKSSEEIIKEYTTTLTLDADVCGKVYEAFGDKKGACVVYNYKTGEILCMVSAPSFDPSNVPENPEEGSYVNNVISSTYPPGSIYKIITTIGLIECIPDLDETRFICQGQKEFGHNMVSCMDGAHGDLGIYSAFAYSCNVAFAEAAVSLGRENMQAISDKLGVTKRFTVSDVKTKAGNFDVLSATDPELAWSGVGQSTNMVNPMYMAMLCGAVANGGTTKQPKYIEDNKETPTLEFMSKSTADKMQDIMRYAVSNYYGDSMFGGLTCGAKTGTAEVEGKESTGWIVGYSTDENYPLAFATVVEEGGVGYYSAGPIASLAMLECARAMGYEG